MSQECADEVACGWFDDFENVVVDSLPVLLQPNAIAAKVMRAMVFHADVMGVEHFETGRGSSTSIVFTGTTHSIWARA